MIICTKEVSVGARKNAYNLLVEIGNTFVSFCGNAKGNTLVFLILCKYIFIYNKKKKTWTESPPLVQMPWRSIWCCCMQDLRAPSPWSPAQCWHWRDCCLSIKVESADLSSIQAVFLNNRGPAHSLWCFFSPRCHWDDHQGTAAAQCLPAPVVSHQRDSQSRLGLHQGHPLHRRPQDASVTCHCHGRHRLNKCLRSL